MYFRVAVVQWVMDDPFEDVMDDGVIDDVGMDDDALGVDDTEQRFDVVDDVDSSGIDVSDNREAAFELDTGRFRGEDGEFEDGSPPPDYDSEANRYRAEDGEFKESSEDLYDEPAEVWFDSLDPEG